MGSDTLYKDILLEHYRHPRNKADPGDADVIGRGRNPRCGDDLEVGIDFAGDTLSRVRFQGRGCSICIASASMMTETVAGGSRARARALTALVQRWFKSDPGTSDAAPEALQALSPIRKQPARHRCVLLAWEALADALGSRHGEI